MEYAQREIGSKRVKCTKCDKMLSTMTNFKAHLISDKHINGDKEKVKEEVIYQCEKM